MGILNEIIGDILTSAPNKDLPKIEGNLKSIGEKGGQKYSDLVDKLVDTLLKK